MKKEKDMFGSLKKKQVICRVILRHHGNIILQ